MDMALGHQLENCLPQSRTVSWTLLFFLGENEFILSPLNSCSDVYFQVRLTGTVACSELIVSFFHRIKLTVKML